MQAQEPTLADVLNDLWQAKFALLWGGVIGLVLAAVFLATAVPHYRASMLVAPAERRAGPDIKALLPDNSSFAVQYLVNTLGSQDSGDYMRFETTLREATVARQLLEDERIVAGVRADRWFTVQDENDATESAGKFSAYLTKRVAIEPVGTTPLRRLVYKHPDPAFAGYLLTQLHEAADTIIRQEIRDRTQSREAYLQQALATVDHPDHRRALTSLLMEQEHVQMILAMDEPFAAIVAEPPAAGVQVYWPRKALALPVGVLAGMLLGYIAFVLRRTVRA